MNFLKSELDQELQSIESALSSTKAKEALCENLPMLTIVCFKIALSSNVSLLEIISSASSACILSKVIIEYITEQMTPPLGVFKKGIGSILLGAYIYITLVLITTFAIESERDGLLVHSDPTLGSEDSSGLVLILLIFLTIFFCLIPFSIYDLIPFICNFKNSFIVWEYFQDPPKRVWYCSIVLLSLGLAFHLMSGTYFLKHDPISLFDNIEPFLLGKGCEGELLGLSLPSILCTQCDLKMGAGRIYFKVFLIFSGVLVMLMYVYSVSYILGMRHRDRSKFREAFDKVLTHQLSNLLIDLQQNYSPKKLCEEYSSLQKNQGNAFAEFRKKNKGTKIKLMALMNIK